MPTKKYRSWGTGTLVKQPSGLFIAKWTYQGKVMTRSTKCYAQDKDGRENALAKLDEFVKPYLESSKIAVLENLAARVRTIQKEGNTIEDVEREQRRIKLVDLYDRYDADITKPAVTTSTMETYSAIIKCLVKWVSKHYRRVVYADELNKDICSEFLMDLDKRVCDHTYNHYVALLDHVWRVLVEEKNVWRSFKLRKAVNKNERRALTKDEMKRLVQVVNSLPFERALLFYLGIYTGMRVSDCCLIKWENVHMDKKYISIVPHKTRRHNHPAFIPIHPVLYTLLEEMWKRSSDHTSFVSKWNAHCYKTNHIGDAISSVFKRCGVKQGDDDYFGFHLLRHTFVSVCANSGVPITVVQAMVGHSCPEITQHYFHMDYRVCMEAVQKISLTSM